MPRRKASTTTTPENSQLLLPYIKATDIKKNGLYLELYMSTVTSIGEVSLLMVHGDWAVDLENRSAIEVSELKKNDRSCRYVFLGTGL
jgi:hypothetical protein